MENSSGHLILKSGQSYSKNFKNLIHEKPYCIYLTNIYFQIMQKQLLCLNDACGNLFVFFQIGKKYGGRHLSGTCETYPLFSEVQKWEQFYFEVNARCSKYLYVNTSKGNFR